MRIFWSKSRGLAIGCAAAVLLASGGADPFAAQERDASVPPSAAAQRCAVLKNLKDLPNATTVIATATLSPATVPQPAANPGTALTPALPEHCEIFGKLNERTGIDGPIGKDNLDAVATWVSCPRPKAAIGGLPYLPLYPKPIFRWHFRPCSSRIQA